MNLWLVRHGQTDLNKAKKMQGRSNMPLNETGIAQAKAAAAKSAGIHFDAVYASPLQRAVTTGSIISGIPESGIIIDERLIEADFGKYEGKPYHWMGLPMTLYWALPEIFPAPETVETIASMVERSSSFLRELEKSLETHPCEHVLISCHGGIMRPLCGYLEGRSNGILWRPKPRNCEFRIYSLTNGKWTRKPDL